MLFQGANHLTVVLYIHQMAVNRSVRISPASTPLVSIQVFTQIAGLQLKTPREEIGSHEILE